MFIKVNRVELNVSEGGRPSAAHSTYTVPRVLQCLSPRLNWHPRSHLQKASVSLPRNQRGGGGTLACGWGGGVSQFGNSDDGRKSLALCLLFAQRSQPKHGFDEGNSLEILPLNFQVNAVSSRRTFDRNVL